MKILMIGDGYVPITDTKVFGGAEKVTLDMAYALKNAGHEVIMSLPSDSELSDFKVLEWDTPSKLVFQDKGEKPPRNINQKAKDAIDSALQNYSFDLIINHNKQPSVIRHVADKNLPKLAYIHNGPQFGLLSVNTNEAYKYFSQHNGYTLGVSGWCKRMNNSCVKDCCDDVNIIQIAKEKFEAVTPIYPNMTIGRFINWKNIHWGVWLAAETGGVVAGYSEKEDDPYYVATIKDKLSEVKHYYNRAPFKQIMGLLAQTEFFIQTSCMETSGCTQFEAAQRGVPSIVCTKRNKHASYEESYLPEFDGENPFYVEVDTYRKSLSGAVDSIKKAIEENHERMIKMENREYIANYIYNNFNERIWYDKFELMLNRYCDTKDVVIHG